MNDPKPKISSSKRSSRRRTARSKARTRKRHAKQIVEILKELYPDAKCALLFSNPFQLLVATILSAQCTDKRVNLVTPALFARFPDPASLAEANPAEVEKLIKSAGFFRAKTKSLIGMSRGLVEHHQCRVPADLEALSRLPGIGRKTAHVVIGTGFQIPSGVVVDTHVKRISLRLGLTEESKPVAVERDLNEALPPSEWIMFSHRMIQHGRTVCFARRPICSSCGLNSVCPRNGVTSSA